MRLFQLETTLHEDGYPWVWQWAGSDVVNHAVGRTHFALEAWERMTTGGVTARYGKSADYPVIIAYIGGRIKWVTLAAC